MCNLNTLQHKIAKLTNNGELILRFLTDTMQAKTPDVKIHHQLEASRQLTHLANLAHSPSTKQDWNGENPTVRTKHANKPAREVSYLDILNFNLAQLIRSETAEGHTITEFLLETLTGRDNAFTPNKYKIKPNDRMTAAREIINRGFGRFGHKHKLIDDSEEANDYDTLHSDLAKRLRQYSEHGSQAILFLLNVMKNDFPNEQYTRRQRVSAAQELLRRGWDTNYDKIKQDHLLEYWMNQESAQLSVGQKKQLAGLHTFADEYDHYDDFDYEPSAKKLREQQDREAKEYERQRNHDNATSNTPSHIKEQNWQQESADKTPKTSPDPEQDCYYEPLSPEDQTLFDYYTLIESDKCLKDETQPKPITNTMRLDYKATLKWMRQVAAKEGVPLLPNPLSGTLKRPNARSP